MSILIGHLLDVLFNYKKIGNVIKTNMQSQMRGAKLHSGKIVLLQMPRGVRAAYDVF